MVSKKVFSLIMVRKEAEILLGFKLRGFGAGKWNGFGGKLEPKENIYECALRELKEECGLSAKNLRQIGILDFEFEGNPILLEVNVFETFSFEGETVETDEMRPKWFKLSDVPFNQMWPDDTIWFPYMLKGIPFRGYFLYRGEETILSHKINESMEFSNVSVQNS
ncbi:7,8-dihydro-8-oxoguanine triphosphatase-like [Belonocnema kinseyi]|uniref:7,8-dihydro-8-oxoguanine triphosphatase-like n=1 Tax=Belonocnema kinseyi TaxID=2817044 RepID=UPI00143CEE75|nr:7,8-dihydro-8-oxoguanine triphosphatase-like [Belonocnema kinseyi]